MGFFVFRKHTGKHAAPRRQFPVPRPPAEEPSRRPAHAGAMSRPAAPHVKEEATDSGEAASGRNAALAASYLGT